jgi:putative transposase
MEYRCVSHTVLPIEYRFVRMMQDRYEVLTSEVAESVRHFVRQTCEASAIRILKGVVTKDHIHILASASPELAPSEIVRRIHERTSSKLFEEFPRIKTCCWERQFGVRVAFCATVGQMTEGTINNYLEPHFEPNLNDNFRREPDIKTHRSVDA